MAKRNTKSIFSADFCKAVKGAVDNYLERDDYGDNCVNAFSLATEKEVAKAFPVENTERLRLLVMTVVAAGEIPGLALRKGRNGGIYRVKTTKARKPRAKAPAEPANETKPETTTEAPAEETAQAANA